MRGESDVFPLFQGLLLMVLHAALTDVRASVFQRIGSFLTPLSAGHLFSFSSSSLRLWAG